MSSKAIARQNLHDDDKMMMVIWLHARSTLFAGPLLAVLIAPSVYVSCPSCAFAGKCVFRSLNAAIRYFDHLDIPRAWV